MDSATWDARVAEYDDLVKRIARRYVGYGNAELDDLIQEGRLSVWMALRRGIVPNKAVIEWRIIDWVRFLRRLIHNDAVAYELLLPIEVPDEV